MFLRQGLGFIVSIVLARLIAPEQFGVIALLYLFTGIAGVFIDSGLSSALIQKQSVSRADESTVFWFNIVIGALAALLLAVSAPWVARWFEQPVLVPLTWALALALFIGSLGAIQATLLTRELDFRTQMKIGVVATIVSGGLAIVLAVRGYGVWALAGQQLASAACTTVLLWILHPWRPALVFSMESARSLFGFGGYLLASALLDTSFTRLYTVLIGKLFGVLELGFYNRASSTQQMPAGLLSGILSRVAFPIFSSANADKAKLRRGVQVSVRGMLLINAPVMLGLVAIAQPLVVTLFGVRWSPAAPVLQVLCLSGVLWPLHVINLNVLTAQGHSHLFFRLEVIKKILGIALLFAGAQFGVLGVAWSMVVFSVAAFWINAWYTGRYLGYSALEQVGDIWPVIMVSAAMAVSVHAIEVFWRAAPPVLLVTQVATGIGFMLIVAPLLRLRALQEAIDLLQNRERTV